MAAAMTMMPAGQEIHAQLDRAVDNTAMDLSCWSCSESPPAMFITDLPDDLLARIFAILPFRKR